MVLSALSQGAETSTCARRPSGGRPAFSRLVKRPVHSRAMSTPRSLCGSSAGSRIAVTLIGPSADVDAVGAAVTMPGKRPCTES